MNILQKWLPKKSLLLLALALGSFAFISAESLAASCPGITRASHPYGLTYPAFNCYTDNYALGDAYGGDQREQNFLRVRNNGGAWSDQVTAQAGDNITVFVYAHNSAKDGQFPANNTQINVNWANPVNVSAAISANNTNPRTVNDTTRVNLANGLSLEPIQFQVSGRAAQNIPAGATSATANFSRFLGSYSHVQGMIVRFRVVSDPLTPNIHIDKDDSTPGTPDTDGNDTQTIQSGDTANFTIKVTNNGQVDLRNVRIADVESPSCVRSDAQTRPLIQAIGNGDTIFNVGESFTYTCTDTNVTNAFTNLAQVQGDPVDGQPTVVDSDTTVVLLAAVPAISIDKDDSTPGTADIDGDDFQQVFSGNTATFTITVTNTGDVALRDVVINDPLSPSCDRTASQTLALYSGSTFAVGDSFQYQCTRDNVTQGFTNIADVTGISVVDGTQVVDQDPTVVEVPPLSPVIDIDKDDSTPGTPDTDGDDTQTVNVGGVATFTIKVTNVGNENLRNIVITDPNNSACDLTVAQTNALITAQGNGDNILNAGAGNSGESFTYTCTDNNVQGPYINTANVVGIGVTRGDVVTDNDPTTVNVPGGEDPSIMIDKDDTDNKDDTQTVASGDAATFTITVTNDGNVGLERVSTGDPEAPNCALSVIQALPFIQGVGDLDAVFDPGESFTYNCTDPNVTASYTNTANVIGFSIFSGTEVNDSDPSDVVVGVINPPTCSASSFDLTTVAPGGNVIYSWTVTDVPTNAQLVCDGAGVSFSEDIGTNTSRAIAIPATATDGQVLTCRIVMPGGTELCSDTVTINTGGGNDPAEIEIIKDDQDNSDDTQLINPNETALFTITVNNTGTVALRDVVITDPRAANCERDAIFTATQYAGGASTDFDPGESFSFTCDQDSWNLATNTAIVRGTPTNGDPNVTDEDSTNITFPGGGGGGTPDSHPSVGVCTVNGGGALQCQGRRPYEDPSDQAWRDYYACTQESGKTPEECVLTVWAPAKGLVGKLCGPSGDYFAGITSLGAMSTGAIASACSPIIPPITGTCTPVDPVCPECFKQGDVNIEKKVRRVTGPLAETVSVAKGDRVEYEIRLDGLEIDESKFVLTSLEIRVHDRLIPADSGWQWGRGSGALIDGDDINTWEWNPTAEYFNRKFIYSSPVVTSLNNTGELSQPAKDQLLIPYGVKTNLVTTRDQAELTNVAFATLIYTYDEKVIDPLTGAVTRVPVPGTITLGVNNTCNVVGQPDLYQHLKIHGATLGDTAQVKIIRPFVEARGGNIAVSGSTRVTGQTGSEPGDIQGTNNHQGVIVEGDENDIFDGLESNNGDLQSLKDNFQSDREAYFTNLKANMVPGSLPDGLTVSGGNVLTHNYQSGVYIIEGGDVTVDDSLDLDRASTFVIEGASLYVEEDVQFDDHFAAFVLRPDDTDFMGNIYVGKDVETMDGVYIVEANAERDEGRIMAYGNLVSEKALTVNGNLIGDLSHLLSFRKYIGNNSATPLPSLVVAFDLRILEATPPILEQFLGQDWREEVSQ